MLVNTVFVLLALAISQVPAGPLAEVPAVYPNGFETPEGSGSRIVSGWDAEPGQHPHQVSLRMISALGTASGCGGSVVHRSWVVSAAHCTAGRLTVIVRAGLVNVHDPEAVQETQETYNFPTFDVNRPLVVQPNDISLIKLQQPLVYSSNLRGIRIQPSADAYRDYNAVVLYASGFGRTWTNGATSDDLQWVFLRGVSNPSCAQLYGSSLITQNSICATFYNVTSQSICQGDSGGPLVNVEADGTPTLVGVTSFVAGGNFGCHSGIPGGFTRPGPFHSWFTQVTGIDFNNLVEEEDEPTTTAVPETTVYITTEESESPETTVVTTTSAPNTTTAVTTPSTPSTTTPSPSTTTPSPPSTTAPPTPEEEEEESEEIDDPEIADLLKRLEVKVKVKVKLSKYLKKRRN